MRNKTHFLPVRSRRRGSDVCDFGARRHSGKQPPCVKAILQAGISRVVVGSADPNPLVGGKGIRILREHGVSVTEDILREECAKLNEVFFHYIRTEHPFVVMEICHDDGRKIAAVTGESKWITGEAARHHVQKLRHRYTAIMAGVGTVISDDPPLTCRGVRGGKNPVRIICDTRLPDVSCRPGGCGRPGRRRL